MRAVVPHSQTAESWVLIRMSWILGRCLAIFPGNNYPALGEERRDTYLAAQEVLFTVYLFALFTVHGCVSEDSELLEWLVLNS